MDMNMQNIEKGRAKPSTRLIIIVLSALCGYMLIQFFFWESLYAPFVICFGIIEGVTLWLLHQNAGLTKRSLWWAAAIAAMLPMHVLFDNPVLLTLNVMLLTGMFFAQLLDVSGAANNKWFNPLFLLELAGSLFVRPFSHIGNIFKGSDKPAVRNKGLRSALLGLAAAVPVLLIVLLLLSSADQVFNFYMLKIFKDFNLGRFVTKLIFTVIFGILYASFMYAMFDKKGVNLQKRDKLANISSAASNSFLSVLNIVYVLFIALQFLYLFGAFSSRLPEGMSYTEYARKGFFELATVGAINLAVLALFVHGRKDDEKRSIFFIANALVLVFTTIVMLLSAMFRLGMYVDAYGLTRLRVYTLYFLGFECILMLMLCVRLFIKRFNFARTAAVFALGAWLVLCYANSDALIARYNADRIIEDKASPEEGDVWYLFELSHDADPQIARLYGHDPGLFYGEEYRPTVAQRLVDLKQNSKNWKLFNFSRMRAEDVLRNALSKR